MMKTLLAGVAAMSLLAGAAQAATLFSDPGGPYSEMLHNDSYPTGTTVTLKSKPSGDFVDLISNVSLDPGGNGNGFAQVDGPFGVITIDPRDPLLGFSKIGFTLNPQDKFDKDKLDNYSFSVDLTFVGGGSQTLIADVFPSFKKFDIWQTASDPGAIATIKIYALHGTTTSSVKVPAGVDSKGKTIFRMQDVITDHTGLTFEDIRHISYERYVAAPPCTHGCGPPPGVPEPATWAMMIVGFGGVGTLLRRRRTVFG